MTNYSSHSSACKVTPHTPTSSISYCNHHHDLLYDHPHQKKLSGMSDDPSKNNPPISIKHSSTRDDDNKIDEGIVDNELYQPYDSFGQQKQPSQHHRRDSSLEDISTTSDFHINRYDSNNNNGNSSPSVQPFRSPFRTPDRYPLRNHIAIDNIEPEPFHPSSQQFRQHRYDEEEGALARPKRNESYETNLSISKHTSSSLQREEASWQALEASPDYRGNPHPSYERDFSSSRAYSSASPSDFVEHHKRRRDSPPSPPSLPSGYSHSHSSLSPYLDVPNSSSSSWRRRQQDYQQQEKEMQQNRRTPRPHSSSQDYHPNSQHALYDSPTSRLTTTRYSQLPPEGIDIRDNNRNKSGNKITRRTSSELKHSGSSTVRSSPSASSIQDTMEATERRGKYSHTLPSPHMYHPHYPPMPPYVPYGPPYGYHPHHASTYHYFPYHPAYAAHSSSYDPTMPISRREYIEQVNDNDVLCGRGGATNSHIGNRSFRIIVKQHQSRYLRAKKKEKPTVAAHVVSLIRKLDPPGRFLKKDKDKGLWFDIGDDRAKEKTSQALREGAPEIRKRKNASSFDIDDAKHHGEDASFSTEGDNDDNATSPSLTIEEISSSRITTTATNNNDMMKQQASPKPSASAATNHFIQDESSFTPPRFKNSSQEMTTVSPKKSPIPPSSSKDEDDNDDGDNRKLPANPKSLSEKDSLTCGKEFNHPSPIILQDISFSAESDYKTFSSDSGSSEDVLQRRLPRRPRRPQYSQDIVIQPALPITRDNLQKIVVGDLSNKDQSLYTNFFDPPHDTSLKSRSNSSNDDKNTE